MQNSQPKLQMNLPSLSEALRAATLLDREARLLKELRFLRTTSCRRQLEIDAELLDIRDDLERLACRWPRPSDSSH
jgi:hypothetical protein